MSLFNFGKKENYEAPLNYWEEKSYMMILPNGDAKDLLKNSIKNLEESNDFNLLSQNYNATDNSIYLNLEYDSCEYEVGMFVGGVSIAPFYLGSILFTDKEREEIIKTNQALTIFMEFNDDVKKCYHFQLKLATILVPDLIGVMDESAEKMLPARWVKLISKSKILPSSKDLFSVQAVVDKNEKVWLHTHGLNRCGLTELEILESNSENQQNHFNLINTYAMYLLDRKEKEDPRLMGAYIGRLVNGNPIVVTCESWTKGVLEYKKLKVGGLEDRKNGHNGFTSIIFLYKSEEDENNKILNKISVYDDLWGDNPLFFFSDEETDRMKALARERFDYIKKAFKDKDNSILLKIGLPLQEEGKFEHIWFELLEFKGDKFKAKLTQEPYYFDDIHAGYENWYTIDDITDWIVYTPNYSVNPDNAFLLDED